MWEKIKNAFQWAKTNLGFFGGLLLTILLGLLTYYKRKASSLEGQLETQEKRSEVKEAHKETEKAEHDYEDQKQSYSDTYDEYNRKYRNGGSDK